MGGGIPSFLKIFFVLVLFCFGKIAYADVSLSNIIFQDNFDTTPIGGLSGQNGWVAHTPANWQVILGASGNQAQETGGLFNSSARITQTQVYAKDVLTSVDFQATTTSQAYILNRSESANGYFVYKSGNSFNLYYYNGTLVSLGASTTVALVTNNWYTFQSQIVNDVNGHPVFSVWVFPQGTQRPASPSVSVVDTNNYKTSAGNVAFGGVNAGGITNFDNVIIYSDDSASINITSPSRSVSSSPNMATLTFGVDDCRTIPYIQTSSSLTVSATIRPGIILGIIDGAKFVLDEDQADQQILYSMSSALASVTFTNVSKEEHTVTVYPVNSSYVVPSGSSSDYITDVEVGDIYIAIGDSVTEGYYGNTYSSTVDWTTATVKSNNNRVFPSCTGLMPNSHIENNNDLENVLGYPVFVMEEGVSGNTSQTYLSFTMQQAYWLDDVSVLQPNKWIVHLGINGAGGRDDPLVYKSDMQQIIDVLNTTYNAESIFLAVPATRNWSSYVNELISANDNMFLGPDFYHYYINYPEDLYIPSPIHPNNTGQIHMGYLWANSVAYPKNVTVSQNAGTLNISWNSLSLGSSVLSTAGYKVKYGTSPGVYTTTVDVGNVTSKTITGLTDGQIYYFAVSAYDSDPFAPNPTSDSSEVSITMDTDAPSTPTTSPSAGTYNSDQSVSLSSTGSDYIKYSLVETPATCSDGTLYSNSISIATSSTIYVRACDNASNSSIQSFAYIIDSEVPSTTIATPTAGTYSTTQSVTLTSTGSDSIRYSIVETPATCSAGTLYTAPLSISSSQTIYVRACDDAGNSSISSHSFTISSNNNLTTGTTLAYRTNFLAEQQEKYFGSQETVKIQNIIRTLKSKTKGDDVKYLQTYLTNKGHNLGNLDGIFGPKTKQAVIKFQIANGLVPDGIVGPKTREKIK